MAASSGQLSSGQRLALRQLRSIALVSPGALEIVSVSDPVETSSLIWVDVSIDCAGLEHKPPGIVLHGRERFEIGISPEFPFTTPSILVRHARWAGTPHVQWRRVLCLYAAPSVEWLPADGMYGYVARLDRWLKSAAAGELDPANAPLHPPVAYVSSGAPLVIPRENAPEVGDRVWLGAALLEHPTDRRYDIVGWQPEFDDAGAYFHPPETAAAAMLLPFALDWEYPDTVDDLLAALHDHGVDVVELLDHIGYVALFRPAGEPMLVIVGTPMRRAAEGESLQHLTAWQIESAAVVQLMLAIGRRSTDDKLRELGDDAIRKVIDWATSAKLVWCPVREARPEVTLRRDAASPMRAFAGKSVAIWGCGALGGPIAEWLIRAGVRELRLYDSATVTPGVLVRQLFDDEDIGYAKANRLAARLRRIDSDVNIVSEPVNVLTGPLSREDWDDGADIVIDATASITVQSKFEQTRRLHARDTTIITALLGHTAEHGVITVALPGHSGGGADVLRQVKLSCSRTPHLRDFMREFWPAEPRTELFQPEPGCSAPTFEGSGAQAAALAATMLTAVASDLATAESSDERTGQDTAIARLIALPTVTHRGPRSARLAWPAALIAPGPDESVEIRVGHPAIKEIRGWISRGRRTLPTSSETGGVLFGERDDAAGVIWVDEISGPPPDSVETPELFLCGTDGVLELDDYKRKRSHGSVGFLGMWHTHPNQSADFSSRDLRGMVELLDAARSPQAQGLVLIVGWAATEPQLAGYVFEREQLRPDMATVVCHEHQPLAADSIPIHRDVGLALSGGGSRAIAFHLGCLRALHDRGVLDRIQVISGVSGGAVMSALWAYSDDDFESFDTRVCELLRRGLAMPIARRALMSIRGPEALGSRLAASSAAMAVRTPARITNVARRLMGLSPRELPQPPVRRVVSRTDALADVLAARVCGDRQIDAPRRGGVDVVINACDLRTGSAFRFGSKESGTWQHGTIVGNQVSLATAVAASAAYPLALPALDRVFEFERRNGEHHPERVVLTDGGVFDNLGTSCLMPGRSEAYSSNVFSVDYIVTCDAGRGLLAPATPIGWPSRVKRSFESTFRKVQDGARGRLHDAAASEELAGFVMPYLGQRDETLPCVPAGLIPRDAVADYPTDFRAMSRDALDMLTDRGEQLTRLLIDSYCPEL